MSHPAPDHQASAAAGVEDLLTLLDRYRKAVALLNTLPRSSPEYASQLKVEMALSRQIHELGQDRARGIKDWQRAGPIWSCRVRDRHPME